VSEAFAEISYMTVTRKFCILIVVGAQSLSHRSQAADPLPRANPKGFRYRRRGDVSVGSVEVACALADLVRDILRNMLAVQALSEMEQGAAGVPISDGSVDASACLDLGWNCVCAGDYRCLVSAAGRCLESLDRSLRTMDSALAQDGPHLITDVVSVSGCTWC
jgi:hypothetical protein